MKKRLFYFNIILSFLAVLLLGGCRNQFNFDSDNSSLVPDGIKINYESDVEFNINDGSNTQTQIEADEDEEGSEEDADAIEDKEEIEEVSDVSEPEEDELTVSEDGEYTSKEEVALYIHLYNHLPSNYITKNEAKELGWVSSEGNLNKVAPGKSIGGDKFGNREGLLPDKKGRVYYECDIDYVKGSRNGKRIVFSNDGLIYYTEDHYETYELLYE
ncbi:MAG: ribonuclease [Lachnospiraceae bacterium]|nr:ribonuclease [Lachnospiraceae bacterium]